MSKRPAATTNVSGITHRNNNNNVCLLLHAVDGVVPYLTPTLLHDKDCFPPEKIGEKLWIGMAVRDTCVQATYHLKPGDDNDDDKDDDDDDDVTNRTAAMVKPRGYTFSPTGVVVDPWMKSYIRMTVPTFDLIHDVVVAATNKSPFNSSNTSTKTIIKMEDIVTATDKHVMLWTPNGRHNITPELYYDCCRITMGRGGGLKSHHVTSLFDTPPPPPFDTKHRSSNNSKNPSHASVRSTQKRQAAASLRTRGWWDHFWSSYKKNGQEHGRSRRRRREEEAKDHDHSVEDKNPKLWPAISVHDGMTESELVAEINRIIQKTAASASSGDGGGGDESLVVAGMALVGWADTSVDIRRRLSESAVHATAAAGISVAVLATRSLWDLLECLTTGVTVIGSDLPRQWAYQKRAFLIDIPTTIVASNDNAMVHPLKKQRIQSPEAQGPGGGASIPLDSDGCLPLQLPGDDKDYDVTQHAWFRDKGPMVQGCLCKTCRTYTRAYVYHLVCSNELLAEMLLFIHNLHHTLELLGAFQTLTMAPDSFKNDDSENAAKMMDNDEFTHFILAQLPTVAVRTRSEH